MTFTPRDPNYESRVRAASARQRVMDTIGATMTRSSRAASKSRCRSAPISRSTTATCTPASWRRFSTGACGYAALSLMPADVDALTVEYKINLLRPAVGDV